MSSIQLMNQVKLRSRSKELACPLATNASHSSSPRFKSKKRFPFFNRSDRRSRWVWIYSSCVNRSLTSLFMFMWSWVSFHPSNWQAYILWNSIKTRSCLDTRKPMRSRSIFREVYSGSCPKMTIRCLIAEMTELCFRWRSPIHFKQ